MGGGLLGVELDEAELRSILVSHNGTCTISQVLPSSRGPKEYAFRFG